MTNTHLILNNIRSTANVGSIFRTADAVGVSKIFITGITPAPVDRFGRDRPDIAKVSLGAEKSVEWEQKENIEELIQELKDQNIEIVALEQSENSIDYKDYSLDRARDKKPKPFVLILGEETKGIPEEILKLCDRIIEIPMKGEKESLNVSVAAGIALSKITEL